jgi:hypothetical protein
MQKM